MNEAERIAAHTHTQKKGGENCKEYYKPIKSTVTETLKDSEILSRTKQANKMK